ncbi:MAG: hypothetical protein JWP06_601 [Candidatus Saccharibacteria bacterium]|nr:hypothetical protein [Candidatus Saccharibacteria bacterium]
MSEQKHVHILSQLSAHPIARNIEWSELIPALSSIGLLQIEKNGSYHFTRNDRTIVFDISHRKEVDIEDVLKLRHFLQSSAMPESDNLDLVKDTIVAIDHHEATIYHSPGTVSERRMRIRADLMKERILHTHPTSAPYHESSPLVDNEYYSTVIEEIAKADRTVILSHGTGTSNAASQLLGVMQKEYPELVSRIVAIKSCDLEAMTEPQLVHSGIDALRSAGTDQ